MTLPKYLVPICISATVIIISLGVICLLVVDRSKDKAIRLSQTSGNRVKVLGQLDVNSIEFINNKPEVVVKDMDGEIKLSYDEPPVNLKAEISNEKNIIKYQNIAEGVSIVYTPLKDGVKEEIVINSLETIEKNSEITYRFKLALHNFKLRKLENGNLSNIIEPLNNSLLTYTIANPFMVDANNVESTDVEMQIFPTDEANIYSLIITPSREWLQNDDRVYPVVIDPTITKGSAPVYSAGFDEGYGQTIYDTSTNSYSATVGATSGSESTDPSWKTTEMCISKNCLYFDGNDDYAFTGAASALDINGTNALTMSSWIRTSTKPSSGNYNTILMITETGQGDTTFDKGLAINSSGYATFYVWDGASKYALGTTDLADGKWHHITGVYDGTYAKVYVDGIKQGSDTAASSTYNFTSPQLVYSLNSSTYKYFIGFVDEVRIYNYARTAIQIKNDFIARGGTTGASSRIGSDLSNISNGLVGFWKMDQTLWNGTTGEVIDSSGNGNNGTSSGASTTSSGKFWYGGSFDGSNDYINLGNVAASSNGAVCMWVNRNGATQDTSQGGVGTFFGRQVNGVSSNIVFEFDGNTNYYPRFYLGGPYGGNPVTATTSVIVNTWTHLCSVWSGTNVTLYINGVQNSSITSATPDYGGGNITAGGVGGSYDGYFSGKLDDIRLYNRNLSPAEISTIYRSAAGPIAYFDFNENSGTSSINDKSGTGLTGTMNGSMQSDDWTPGKFGSALEFDGTDDSISITSSTMDDVYPVTYSFWYKPKTDSSDYGGIISKTDWAIDRQDSTNSIEFYHSCNPDHLDARTPDNSITIGNWYHISVTWNGTCNLSGVQMFINGVKQTISGGTTSGTPITDAGDTLYIGYNSVGGGNSYFTGLIDDLKIYGYIRTPSQIVEDMNGGHPVGGSPIGSQVGYWKFNEGYGDTTYDWSPHGNNGNLGGATSCPQSGDSSCPSWTGSGKFDKALDFEDTSTGDYVTVSDSSSLDITSELSISAWIRLESNTGGSYFTYVLKGDGTTTSNYYMQVAGDEVAIGLYNSGWYYQNTTSANLQLGTWYHVVGTYNYSINSIKIYVNGVSQALTGNGAENYSLVTNSDPLYIGVASPGYEEFDGMIDELKIYAATLTDEQVRTEYLGGVATKFGSKSTTSTDIPDDSYSREFCVPGSSDTCSPPIAEWKFDEISGTSANDSSGNGLTLTNDLGTTSISNGKTGKSRSFDNTTGNTMKTGAISQSISSISASAWVYPREASSTGREIQTFIHASGPSLTAYVLWMGYGTGNTRLALHRGNWASNGRAWDCVTNTNLTLNEWNHIGFTTNGGATDTVSYYINGKLVCSTASTTTWGSGQVGTTVSSYNIGGTNGWSSTYYDGLIDDVRIYDYVRTSSQFAWEYNRGAPYAWYKFDECTGTSIYSWGPNANNGFTSQTGTLSLGASGTTSAGTSCTTGSGTSWYNGANGVINASMDFDGTDDYVQISGLLGTPTDISLCAWVSLDSSDSSGAEVISLGDTVAIRADSRSGATGTVGFYQSSANNWFQVHTDTDIAGTGWRHLCYVIDDLNDDQIFYIDGREVARTAGTNSIVYTGQGSNTMIGKHANGSANYDFNGKIDDVRVYNYALTPRQIKEIKNAGAVKFN